MAEHESCIGKTSESYTPPEIFKALDLTFDLDPCSPGSGHWVPAKKIYTKEDDGFRQPWCGLVFMNPPFGGRNGHVRWQFLDHGSGVAIVRAYTSSGWWHEYVVPRAELLCFPKGKTKFIRPDGSIGKAPGHGVVSSAWVTLRVPHSAAQASAFAPASSNRASRLLLAGQGGRHELRLPDIRRHLRRRRGDTNERRTPRSTSWT